nr:hypothetical protein [Tanacetum cinerariifolium]
MQQKEETFQVVIDFWYTIKKVKDSESYELLLANKKCIVNAKVLRKILDICLRVKGEEFIEEYGLPIPDMMLNDKIKQLESYQMFIKYSTGQIPPKKSRDKGSHGKKTADTPMADVDVSEESKPELVVEVQGVRRLGTGGSNEGTCVSPGVPDESTVVPTTLSEGISTKPGVRDEEKVTSEEKIVLDRGSEQESEYSKEDQDADEEVDWIDSDEDEEKKDDTDDEKSINLEMTDDEETDDEFVHGDEQVNDNEDEEMTNDEVKESGNGDEENTNVLRVAKLEKEVSELKKIDHSAEALATLMSKVPNVIEHYLGSKINDDHHLGSKINDDHQKVQ